MCADSCHLSALGGTSNYSPGSDQLHSHVVQATTASSGNSKASPLQPSLSTPQALKSNPNITPLRHLGGPGEDSAKACHDGHQGFSKSSKTLGSEAAHMGLPNLAKAKSAPVTPVAKERRPLMKKHLDAASWKLYQQQQAAREPRKPLSFQYPAGVTYTRNLFLYCLCVSISMWGNVTVSTCDRPKSPINLSNLVFDDQCRQATLLRFELGIRCLTSYMSKF